MEYTKATIDDMEAFYDLVQNTIQEVYPKYYPEEVVRFFSQQHCWENLERDLEEERIYILQDGECVIGAGSFEGNPYYSGLCEERLSETWRWQSDHAAVGRCDCQRI